MAAKYQAWLKSVLRIKPGGKHRDLGSYRKQGFGVAFGLDDCPQCGAKLKRGAKHDPCIRNLPGAVNACCGHGMVPPYVTLRNGWCLDGSALETYLEKIGRWTKLQVTWRPYIKSVERHMAREKRKKARRAAERQSRPHKRRLVGTGALRRVTTG